MSEEKNIQSESEKKEKLAIGNRQLATQQPETGSRSTCSTKKDTGKKAVWHSKKTINNKPINY